MKVASALQWLASPYDYAGGGYKMLRPSQSEQMERKTALMFLAAHVKEGCIKM